MRRRILRWTVEGLAFLLGTTALRWLFRALPVKLADNAVIGWLDDAIAQTLGLSAARMVAMMATISDWGPPLVSMILLAYGYHRFHRWMASTPQATPTVPPEVPVVKPASTEPVPASIERSIVFQTINVEHFFDQGVGRHVVTSIQFLFKNTGGKMLRYNMKKTTFQIGMATATAEDLTKTTGFIGGGETLSYGGALSAGVEFESFPIEIRVHLIMDYDNVPPTAPRTTEIETIYTFQSLNPVVATSRIVRRDER